MPGANPCPLCSIGIQYAERKIDDISVRRSEQYDIDLFGSKQIGDHEIETILSDHQQLGELLVKHPDEVRAILNDVFAGRQESARNKAKAISLTEEQFKSKSGGLIGWIALGVAIAILLYPSDAN